MNDALFLNCWSEYHNDHYDAAKCSICGGTGVVPVEDYYDNFSGRFDVEIEPEQPDIIDYDFSCEECGAIMKAQLRQSIETAYALSHDVPVVDLN